MTKGEPKYGKIISDEMEIEAEIHTEKKLQDKALKSEVPEGEKADITVDNIYSSYYDAQLQIKLNKTWDRLNSPMRIVGDYLDMKHYTLKTREITYKEIADALGLTESQVYAAIQNLNAYKPYGFAFHPTRKKHTKIKSYGSFKFSNDDYNGWAKEDDIREKIINRKIIVIDKSRGVMRPKYKEEIKKHKIAKIKELKAEVEAKKTEERKKAEAEEQEMVEEVSEN
jgi:hypothetical protein